MSVHLSDEIQQSIRTKILEERDFSCEVIVTSDDQIHFQVVVISDVFQGLSRVKRQHLVYDALSQAITQGRVHAVALKTYTLDEWMSWKNKNE